MPEFRHLFAPLSWRRCRLGALTATLSVAVLGSACGSELPGTEDAIDRAVFIQTYVDLRMSALDTDSQRLADPARDSILQRNGVTVDELTHFATVWANDPEFMRDVWTDIEGLLDTPARSEN